MPVPFLSTGLVGNGSIDGSSVQELIGPGHASFVNDVTGTSRGSGDDNAEEDWRVVFHASTGSNCNRHSFMMSFYFGDDDWPYLNIST